MTTELIVRREAHTDLIGPAIDAGLGKITARKIREGERSVILRDSRNALRREFRTFTVEKIVNSAEGPDYAIGKDENSEPWAVFLA